MLPMPLVEQEISLPFLESADEIFLTNALRGIRPVARFGEIKLSQYYSLIIREHLEGVLAAK
jgi:branched-subunit amino acid aminotransferase/4-amino-4-deoxychorismate lyase